MKPPSNVFAMVATLVHVPFSNATMVPNEEETDKTIKYFLSTSKQLNASLKVNKFVQLEFMLLFNFMLTV